MKNLIKIGLFSKIAQVTVRTLRHYDDIGLLKPAYIEPNTNYRYYTYDQLIPLNHILVLKDVGFSLDQISTMIQKEMSIEEMKQMMNQKKVELTRQMNEASQQIKGIEMRLSQLSQVGQEIKNHNIVLKQGTRENIIALRRIVPKPEDMPIYRSRMFQELGEWASRMKCEIHQEYVFYHINEFVEEDFDIEVAYSLHPNNRFHSDGNIRLYEIPAEPLVASLVYRGSFAGIGNALLELFSYLGINGYSPTGPVREIHLFGQENSQVDCYDVLLELQVPISR